MFGKKILDLTSSAGKVRACLEGQLNKRRPTGSLREGKFSLYKCMGSSDQGGFFYFQIAGEYTRSGEGTRVVYRILPDLATCLILLCSAIALVCSGAALLGGEGNGDLVLTILAVNLILWAYSLWGIRDLGARFESLLQETQKD